MKRILAVGFGLILLGGASAQEQAPELKVLDRWVGTWKTEAINKPAEWNPKETKIAGTVTGKWILGSKFVEESWSSQAGGSEHRFLWSYDPQRKMYRNWFFGSDGTTGEGTGTWDEKTNTMTWKTEPGPGLTGNATCRFLDADTYEWTYIIRDGAGKAYLDMKGKHTRVK
jgi:hypothetical protein